jgi:hypothetical protein
MNECTADTECTPGLVCATTRYVGGCLCQPAPNPLRKCVPPCTPQSCDRDESCNQDGHCGPKSCADGYPCGPGMACSSGRALADAHGCAPSDCAAGTTACPTGERCEPGKGCIAVPCTEGYECPVNHVCNPTSNTPHRCVRRSCTADADCDCGACINATCQDRLFVCSLGVP